MSQTSSNKGKEISSKKYTSFNISQTFKSKVDNKTGSVQGLRHGMQSLGKIGQSRRVLQPASLPSLKKENSGNDPRVNLVPPTGSQGWVKKDGQSSVDGTPSGSIDLTKTTVVKNPTNNQEISLRPHAGVVPGARPSTGGGVVEEGQKPSWVSKVQPQPPQGATKYFQREFPTLGGDVEKDITAENHAEKTEQDANHLVMAHHQAFINGQKWMDGSNSPMMVPANFSQFKGDPAQMFSGQQQCYSFPMQMYPGDMHNYPLHPMYMPYTTGPAGKIPLNLYQRIPNSVLNTNPQPDQTSVSKDSDKDDNGWAGAQEEVDYNAKLKFDESDESDDDAAKKPKEENSQKLDQSEEHKQEKNKAPPEGWTESQSFPTQVHMQPAAYNHQTWSRMPFNFDPRAPVPYFFIPRYPFPVVMPTPSELSDRNIENKSKEAEHLKESPPIKPDDKREADRKAAAQAKLRKVEEDIKKREAEKKHNEADGKKTSSFEIEDKVNVGLHKRSDSEASDSSRHTRDIPPRFQRQVSAQKQSATSISSEVNPNDTIVDSHMRTILKRKESYKSDEEFVKDDLFKKPDSVESTGHEPEKTSHEVKVNQTTSSLNQETLKAEHKSSSEVIDKPHKLSNVTNKEVVRKPTLHPDKEKKGLKELTDFKAEIKNRDQKKNEIILTEKNQDSRFDSERFADFKLTKGQVKKTKLGKEKGESASATEFQEREPSRTSAWNKVLPNETNQSSATKKSLIEIQKEEEELSKKAVEGKLLDKSQIVAESINGQERSSPTENKFRSDTYQNKPFPKHENEHQNDHRGRLDDDSKRRYNKFERDNQKHDFKSRDDGYRDHPRDNYRKRNEYIPKDSLLQSNEESLTKSSQKDYDVRRESRRDYPRYNDREGFKKEYDRPKRDRGDREYNKYKKDRGDADYEKYKKERGDGEKDRYKKDRGDNESDRYKKDRGDGENERYRKDKVDVESDRFKKVRSDLEYTRIKKDKGETDYENKHKKDKGELEHDRIKKDRGDGEFERHKKDRGDGEFERHKKDRGDGEYDRFKKDRGDASYKRNGKVDKYSEKFLPKSASIELQVDLVDLKQEMSTEKSINKSNEGDKILKPIKRDNEKYETSRRDREFYSRNIDRKKEYSSDYHKQDRRGSRRNDRKDSFYDKDSGKKYSNKFSHEDDLKTSKRDSIISKEVKTENITLDASEKVSSKDEDLKNVAEAKEQKDSGIVKDMPKKDSSNKEVIDIKSDTFTKGDCTKEISVPQPKSPKYKSRKIDDHYRFTDKSSYNYLDSKDEAYEGVGRGRGRQSRGHEHSSGNKSNDKIRLSLEDVSDEELISGDEGSSLKTRKPGKKTHQKTWEHDRPPRFQQKYENEDVFRGKGVRGSDRSRTNHGRGRGASNFHSRVEEKITQENVNKNSSEVIGSVDEQSPIATNQQFAEQRRPQSNQDRGFKSRGRNSYRGNGSSSSSGLRLDKSDSFLVNRQQLGSTHTSSNIANPQTAADKIDSSELDENILNKKSASNLEGISTTSPTKKNKPAEKKRDIRREFDLSNIASVVCIDDMKNFDSISIKSTEDDGFVKVTSKKHQKELRDKYREEEKRKVLLEQKKEASKAQKLARKEKVALKKAVAPVPEVSVSISEQLPVSAHIPLPVTSVTPISQPPTSNLHDMMGVWEPAQSLMRTSQSNPLSDQISSAGSVSSNAWQRPLTLTSTSASLPDPRAVGTGKPVSVPGAIKVTIMPTQATPEAASPIVTPPPLAPIISGNGVSMISELDNSNTNLKRDFAKNKSSEGKQQLSQNTHKAQITNDEVQRKVRSNPKKEPKSASKKYLPERPPRFQANLRKNGDERTKKYSEPRKEKYSGKRDEKSHRLSDRLKKVEKFPSDIKPPKSVEKPIPLNNNEVFLNENVSEEMQTKSLLSEEEKVVGSKKPSIKTQTSVGSYKSSDVFEEPVKEVKLANQFQTPQDNINKSLSKESEKNAKKTAQSLVKSITGDEERSLETRSLPGSPSLAVKIPEPTLCGPSSDPGKVPDPNINKFASSIAQEMNEMNRKLLDAKKAWDETPTAWSDSASKVKTVSVVSSSSASDSIPAHTECLPTVTKFEQLSTVSITEVKSTEEKASQSFPNKRPEQQNICKVKPQQQIPSEDSRAYISTNLQHNVSNLPTQSNRSRYVLNMDRQVQANIYESVYSDQLRTQGNQLAFSRLGHIHSIDQVVPPMSQRPEMVLSSLPVGNPNSHLFGIDPSIQNNQNALLTWQVVSTTNVQPTKTLHYPAQHHQGSLFTSPSSSQLVMPYGSAFSPQRSSTGIQRQALMQHNQTAVMSPQEVNLNIQEPYVGRVVGVLQPQPAQSQARRDHHQQFQGILPSQPLLGTNSMTLLLDPSNAQTHLSQQQRSDLMKHVHAKPFEPTSQTPPLMQSPPVLSHHHSATPMPQQVISTVFSQSVTHQQTQQKYSQPLIHRQTNHQQANPLVAPVRPRAVHGQSSGTSPPLRTLSNHQEQIMNNHHFDQNFVFPNALGLGHPPRGSVIQPVHVTPHPISSQYVGSFLQQPYQQNVQSRPPTFNHSQNKPPGPIQRPLQISPSNYSSINHSSNDEEFKRIQRQKMLDDTKKYFQSDGSAPNGNNGMAKEDVSSTSTTLSKHDKLIIPDKQKDKRFDFKKSVRNGEQTRGTRNQRQKSSPSTNSSIPPGKAYDASQSKRSTSKV